MIMTVAELRQLVNSEETDQALEVRLQALELLIRAYTNNNFQVRAFRAVAVAVEGNQLMLNSPHPFRVGDTLHITESDFNAGLVNITAIDGGTITVKEELFNESGVLVTKVQYPANLKMGVANMLKWDLENRDKIGVQSETVSRHSITYFNMDGDNSTVGYPKSLLGFLRPYMKARFGG